jgi:hypothetical protein
MSPVRARSPALCKPDTPGELALRTPGVGERLDQEFCLRQVHCSFNWAANKARLIAQNPFRDFSHRPGAPRRDMTREEFQGLLRGTDILRPRLDYHLVFISRSRSRLRNGPERYESGFA